MLAGAGKFAAMKDMMEGGAKPKKGMKPKGRPMMKGKKKMPPDVVEDMGALKAFKAGRKY